MKERKKYRNSTLYFGRVHISSADKEKVNFSEKMKQFLSESKSLEDDSKSTEYKWFFGNIKEFDANILRGTLCKVLNGRLVEVFDEDKKILVEKEAYENIAVDKSYFWIFFDKHLITFERRRFIGEIQFQNLFTTGFSTFFKKKYAITIDLLPDKKEITKVIKEADKFISIEFSIQPTNPDPNPEADRIDQLLQEVKAKSGKVKLENVGEGLDVTKKGNIINSAIALCTMGYGSFKGEFIKNKEILKVFSKKQILKEEVRLLADIDLLDKKALEKTKEIMKRLKDE